MLERLLDILQGGGSYTVDDVARRLDVTPALVEMMIDDLMRLGDLAATATACTTQCEGCSRSGCLTAAGTGRIWTWTGKGRGNGNAQEQQ
jgi:hypothetical protein